MSEIDSAVIRGKHGNCDLCVYVDGKRVTDESDFRVVSFDMALKRLTVDDYPLKLDSTGEDIERRYMSPSSFACVKDKTEVLYSWGR